MRSLLRNMAKAEMVRRGYPKVNRQMHRLYGDWRSLIGAYPTSLTTGKPMANQWQRISMVRRSIRRDTLITSLCTEQN